LFQDQRQNARRERIIRLLAQRQIDPRLRGLRVSLGQLGQRAPTQRRNLSIARIGHHAPQNLAGHRRVALEQEHPATQQLEPRRRSQASLGTEQRVTRFVETAEPQQGLDQPRGAPIVGRRDLGEAQKLLAGVFQHAGLEIQTAQIRACWHEARIDGERLAVVVGGFLAAPLFVGERAFAMVRVRQVLVDARGSIEQLLRAAVVATGELRQPEVDERLDETRVVLEGHGEARLGGGQITGREGLHPQLVELDGPRSERRLSRAPHAAREHERDQWDDEPCPRTQGARR
jgi:hypothetical protein